LAEGEGATWLGVNAADGWARFVRDSARELSGERASGSLGQESRCWAARGVWEGREERATREWAGDGVGLRRKKRNGPRWKFLGRRETAGWAQAGLGLGLPFLFLVFSLLFLFQTSHYLFEFKFEFEFNSSTQTNKTILQHECTNMLALK